MPENLLQTCGQSYKVQLASCADSIKVSVALTPATAYYYKITDKHNNAYANAATTDEDGAFTIDAADFIKGLFNPYAGVFTLKVYSSSISCVPLPLNFCGEFYDAVIMTFENVFSDSVPTTQNIECCE